MILLMEEILPQIIGSLSCLSNYFTRLSTSQVVSPVFQYPRTNVETLIPDGPPALEMTMDALRELITKWTVESSLVIPFTMVTFSENERNTSTSPKKKCWRYGSPGFWNSWACLYRYYVCYCPCQCLFSCVSAICRCMFWHVVIEFRVGVLLFVGWIRIPHSLSFRWCPQPGKTFGSGLVWGWIPRYSKWVVFQNWLRSTIPHQSPTWAVVQVHHMKLS